MKSQAEALEWRYAVKAFDPQKKVPAEKLTLLLQAARLAPSSFGLQPYHVTVIENRELKEKLRPVSWNQSQITDCSHLVVFQIENRVDEKFVDDYVSLIAQTRGIPASALSDYRNMMVGSAAQKPGTPESQEWSKRQAYIAMGFLLFSAAVNEIDTCPLEGISAPDYDRILNPSDKRLQTVAAVAIGYRSANDQFQNHKKVRQPDDQFFTKR